MQNFWEEKALMTPGLVVIELLETVEKLPTDNC